MLNIITCLTTLIQSGIVEIKDSQVLKFPWCNQCGHCKIKFDDILNAKPKSIIVHVGTNDLTNDVNLLNNVKKIVNKTKKKSPNTKLCFSDIIIRTNKKNLEKSRVDTNARLKKFLYTKKPWFDCE